MKGFDGNASGKNMKTVSLSKRLIMAADPALNGFLNNTTDFVSQMQMGVPDQNTLMQH
jgi:hypothetical protein